jgi:hypothetical protein
MAMFLLWNVQRRPLGGLLVHLVQQFKVHVVILVERPELDLPLLQALQTLGNFARVPCHDRFGIYSRFLNCRSFF